MIGLSVVSARRQSSLLREVAQGEPASLSALRGQAFTLNLGLLVLGSIAALGLTFLLFRSLRSFKLAHARRVAGDARQSREEAELDAAATAELLRLIEQCSDLSNKEDLSLPSKRVMAAQRSTTEASQALERIELLRLVREQGRELAVARDQIVRSASAKEVFVASMSHELRTPLHAVLGLSEAMRDEVHGSLSDQQRRFLCNIEESGRHLLGLVNNILDIARAGTEQLCVDLSSVNVADLCYSSIAAVTELARRKKLHLETKIDPRVETIQADEGRFRQILVSLLSNAVKFTLEGGRVGLEVEGDAEGGVVRFTVWDTGIGIAPKDVRRLFRPFVQEDGRLARRYEGTGLGLTLVYHLADLHLGGISVKSLPEAGSRFAVSVPWRSEQRSLPASSLWPDLKPSAPILLVAQNKTQIDGLVTCLESLGGRVLVAESSLGALALARQETPSLILLKVRLSEVEDLELVETIREDPRLRNLPIIALTALAVPGERERCVAAGVDDVLLLPVRDLELLEAVQGQVARGSRRQKLIFSDELPELPSAVSPQEDYRKKVERRSNSDAA